MGARYYDPTLARFTELDPAGHLFDLRQGDRYGYAGDDPINTSDPSGELGNITCYSQHTCVNDPITNFLERAAGFLQARLGTAITTFVTFGQTLGQILRDYAKHSYYRTCYYYDQYGNCRY